MSPITDIDALRRASTGLTAACAGVAPGALDDPTPCDEWTITQLLDHVTGGNRFTLSILGGGSAASAMRAAIDSFGEGHDAVAAVVASTHDQLAEFDKPGVFDRICDHVVGTIPATEVLRLRVHDLIVHTWDLNQALGAEPGLDPVLAAWCCAELARSDSLTARSIELAAGAPTDAAGLLTAFGRRPSGFGRG